jgi:hypothetical protein
MPLLPMGFRQRVAGPFQKSRPFPDPMTSFILNSALLSEHMLRQHICVSSGYRVAIFTGRDACSSTKQRCLEALGTAQVGPL